MSVINCLVEGDLDEAVAKRLIVATGHSAGIVYGRKGYGYIKSRVQNFNSAARSAYYLTLVDLMDSGASCPPQLVTELLPHRSPFMLLRVVVREIESWLLADRDNLAKVLSIPKIRIPMNPEAEPNPKLALINAARGSRRAAVRAAITPPVGSTAQVGRLYTSTLTEFVASRWDLQAARLASGSLHRCLGRLESLP